jgi:hypothetical protein
MLVKESPELEVALTTETELLGRMGRAITATLSLHEHGQLERHFVVRVNRQGAMRAKEGLGCDFEVHGGPPLGQRKHQGRITEKGGIV